MKKGMSTGCVVALVVGLVIVFFIIVVGVLAFLGIAGGRSVIGQARVLKSRAAMKGLDIAINGFQTEYGRLPTVPDPPPAIDGDACDSTEARGRMVLDALLGEDDKENPRKIRFWESPPPVKSTGYTNAAGLVDPWGKNGYRILLDDNGDGHISDPEKVLGEISGKVLIYSAGPDSDFITWKDNVCSWK